MKAYDQRVNQTDPLRCALIERGGRRRKKMGTRQAKGKRKKAGREEEERDRGRRKKGREEEDKN